MSAFLSAGAAAIGLVGNWRAGLQPGSWRGVPFLCRDTSRDAGRRVAKFEFADSDQVQVQDLGRGIKTYRLAVYVCGDNYMAQRDALEAALDQDGAGTLVHPYKGPIQVYAEHPCQLKELSEKGRAAYFECQFVEAGGPSQPAASPDNPALAFNAGQALFGALSATFSSGVAFLYDGMSQIVQTATTGMLTDALNAVGGFLTAAGSAAAALAPDLLLLAAVAPDDTSGYATALANLVQDYVSGIATDAAAATVPDPTAPQGYQDSSRLPPLPPDPSYGLAALAAISTSAYAPLALSGQAASNWTAVTQIVGGSATAALMMLYAQTSFTASADADAARSQVQSLTVAQIEAAAGNDALVAMWRSALTAVVTYLTDTAKQASQVAQISMPTPQPALVLAQLLYQDGTQAAALVQRNGAPHPLFMPLTVEYLVAA
jgi:prophage DNA circulation protein